MNNFWFGVFVFSFFIHSNLKASTCDDFFLIQNKLSVWGMFKSSFQKGKEESELIAHLAQHFDLYMGTKSQLEDLKYELEALYESSIQRRNNENDRLRDLLTIDEITKFQRTFDELMRAQKIPDDFSLNYKFKKFLDTQLEKRKVENEINHEVATLIEEGIAYYQFLLTFLTQLKAASHLDNKTLDSIYIYIPKESVSNLIELKTAQKQKLAERLEEEKQLQKILEQEQNFLKQLLSFEAQYIELN